MTCPTARALRLRKSHIADAYLKIADWAEIYARFEEAK